MIAVVMRHLQQMPGVADAESDEALLRRLVETKSESDFSLLVQKHGSMVWGVCRNLLPNEEDAEDAFQAVFLALFKSASRIRDKQNPGAWLHGVAVRLCVTARSRAAKRKNHEARAASEKPKATEQFDPWHDQSLLVHQAIAELPAKEKAIFVDCVLQGQTQTEVARRMKLKINTVSGLLSRARKRLQTRLKGAHLASTMAMLCVSSASAGTPAILSLAACRIPAGLDSLSPSIVTLSQSLLEIPMKKFLLASVLVTAIGLAGVGSKFLSTADGQDKGSGTGAAGKPASSKSSGGGGGGGPGAGPGGVGGPGAGYGGGTGGAGGSADGPGAGGSLGNGGLGAGEDGGLGAGSLGGEGQDQPGGGGRRGNPGAMGGGMGRGNPGFMGPRWEYKQVTIATSQFDNIVNPLGDQGWDIVNTHSNPTNSMLTVILKRRKGSPVNASDAFNNFGAGMLGGGAGMGAPGAGSGPGANAGTPFGSGGAIGGLFGGRASASGGPAAGAAVPSSPSSLNILLQHGDAVQIHKTLKELGYDKVTVDVKHNSLTVKGDPNSDSKMMNEVLDVVRKLDKKPTEQNRK